MLSRSGKEVECEASDVCAKHLMEFIDGEREIEVQSYARFFRKKIAYFEKGENGWASVTWLDAAEAWIQAGGKSPRDLEKILKSLPYGFMSPAIFVGDETLGQTFREFVFEKTVQGFEETLGTALPVSVRGAFLKAIENEKTRRDLVFYTRYPPSSGKKMLGTPDALAFLHLKRKWGLLKAKYFFDPGYEILIEWTFHWKMTAEQKEKLQKELYRDPKPRLDLAIGATQLFRPILDPSNLNRFGMNILLEIAPWPMQKISEEISLILNLTNWKFHDSSDPTFIVFLKTGAYRKVSRDYGMLLSETLERLGTRGKSALFLKALQSPLSVDEFEAAVDCLEKLEMEEISTDSAIRVLLNFPNNQLYIKTFHEEFSCLSSEQKLSFLRRENDSFPEIAFMPETIRFRASFFDPEFRTSPYGKFLVLCKITAPDAKRHLEQFNAIMKKAQTFVGFPLKTDFAAELFFFDCPIEPFVKFCRGFVEERNTLIDSLGETKSGILTERSKKRLIEASSEFEMSYSSEEGSARNNEIAHHFSALKRYIQSGLTCIQPSAIISLIKNAEDENDHHFVSLGKELIKNRKLCGGWRRGGLGVPIFDLSLIDTVTFRSSVIHIPLSIEGPVDEEILKYLSSLVYYCLNDLNRGPIPIIPKKFENLTSSITKWIDELRTLFRRAIWEMATGKPLNMGPIQGAFSLFPIEGEHFSFHTNFDSEQVSSKDCEPKLLLEDVKESPVFFEIDVLLLGVTQKVECVFSSSPIEKGIRWSLESCGISLNVAFPHDFFDAEEKKIRALSWQMTWLKGLIFNEQDTSLWE